MGHTFLICDNNAIYRSLLRTVLEKDGNVVLEVEDGEEAIKVYEQRLKKNKNIDVVFMDYSLSNINGIQVLNEIKRKDNQAKLVLFTSKNNNDSLVVEAMKNGIQHFLSKPFKSEEVYKVIGKLIA